MALNIATASINKTGSSWHGSGPIPAFARYRGGYFANAGIKGPLEDIDANGGLDLAFAYECSTGGWRTSNPLY